MTTPIAMPGDAVVYTGETTYEIKHGEIGIIDGIPGCPEDTYIVTWHYSAFRGGRTGYTPEPQYVSVSGGPGYFIKPSDLAATGRMQTINFWRWIDLPRADGGEHYNLDVPLWEWKGKP